MCTQEHKQQESYIKGHEAQDAGSVCQAETGPVWAEASRDGWELPGRPIPERRLRGGGELGKSGEGLLNGRGLSLCCPPSTVPSYPAGSSQLESTG